MTESLRARALALYLPQFHPIPENDEWWGAGFTEWTNVAKARPLFRGHVQPRLPGELGFYDLRLPESREAQASLASEYGVEGFVYWHYWFGDSRRILERPLREVLESGRPALPFCLGWANQTWTGVWHGEPNRVLVEQLYPGVEDYRAHFAEILPALRDERAVRVDGKSLFIVFRPTEIPDGRVFVDVFRDEAEKAGLPGLHLVGFNHDDDWDPRDSGFDAAIMSRFNRIFSLQTHRPLQRLRRASLRTGLGRRIERARRSPLSVYDYAEAARAQVAPAPLGIESYPCVLTNWDNSPRSGRNGVILTNPDPDAYEAQLRAAVDQVQARPHEHRIVILKSWNEWAEGNYLEPDREHRRLWLERTAAALRGH
jgi:hypothetical protein